MSAEEEPVCPRSESGDHEWKRAWDPTEQTFRMYCPACGHYGANADGDPPEDNSGITVVLRDATGEPYKNELPPPQDLQPKYLENVHERREVFAFQPGDEVIVILQAKVIRAGGGEVRVELRTEGSLHGWVADFAEKYVAPTMSTRRNRRPT
jgi:hypothetical protein